MPFLPSPKRLLLILFISTLTSLYRQSKVLRSCVFHSVEADRNEPTNFQEARSHNETDLHTDLPSSSDPSRKWAYAFLIGGCTAKKPYYRGFLYNVLVAVEQLRNSGSKADFVVFIQMSASTDEVQLPHDEARALKALGIKVTYLPKLVATAHEVFYALVQEKFRILELTEYSRVIFVDGDIMPLCSLDYLFELSDPEDTEPLLKENVVLSYRDEPANSGLFMLQPNKKDYEDLQQIIRRKEEKALLLPYPHWDPVEGWGHQIKSPDHWRTPLGTTGTNWTWHAVFADQGLLYHWTKYVKQNVSLIIKREIEHWTSENGTAVLEGTIRDGWLSKFTCRPPNARGRHVSPSPYQDFVHFTGQSKPWEAKYSWLQGQHEGSNVTDESSSASDAVLQWYSVLRTVGTRTNLFLNFSSGQSTENAMVGRHSNYGQMIRHIRARSFRKWNHYESH